MNQADFLTLWNEQVVWLAKLQTLSSHESVHAIPSKLKELDRLANRLSDTAANDDDEPTATQAEEQLVLVQQLIEQLKPLLTQAERHLDSLN